MRRTELKRGKGLKRGQPNGLKRGKPLQRSRKGLRGKRQSRERSALVAKMLKAEPRCRIRWDAGCWTWATTCHDLLFRSHGGDPTDEANNVPTCGYCHGKVHDNPRLAAQRGWRIPHSEVGRQ